MRLIFCGTPQFAVPSLQRLLAQPDFEIAAVITQPDRPKGRGNEIIFSPVKQAALAANLPVHQPAKIRAPEFPSVLQDLAPDAIVIIAYGQIIPARLLAIPQLGWINLHASLLPKYRGAAPINWAIANGETVSGITTMRIDAGMDTGELLLQKEIPIGSKETAPELAARMSEAGAPLMLETLRGLASGSIAPQAQNHELATLAPILKKEDGRIDWNRSAQQIFNRIRGFAPWPGASTTFRGQNCQIWGEPFDAARTAETLRQRGAEPPGTILPGVSLAGGPPGGSNWLIRCGDTTLLRLTDVKLEGRKQISAADFANGVRLVPGDLFR
jgi:methionyl-tRNA formyltransferase